MTGYKILKRLIFLFLIFVTPASLTYADDIEINGLILDRTITLSGHDFYKKFSSLWLATNMSQSANLVVTEKPSARWGSLIMISSQQKMLYRTAIRPGKPLKDSDIKYAASTVSQSIFNQLFSKHNSQDMDPVGY